MKKEIIVGMSILILVIPMVSSQLSGGGSSRELSPEEVYEISDDFTKCLIDNCDYFCKKSGLTEGYYYKEKKCWCESYAQTAHGKILSDEGWIGIEQCSQEEIGIESDVSSPESLRRQRDILIRQRDILIVVISIALVIIIALGVIIYQLRRE